jgi:hypothetical protein
VGQSKKKYKGLLIWDATREKVFGRLAGLFLHDPDVAELQRITVAL